MSDGDDWLRRLGAARAEPSPEGAAPDATALWRILEIATTVPDHGRLRPWRFAVVAGSGRAQFGEALVAGLHEERGADLPEAMVAKMRRKAFAAPCAVAVIASPDPTSNVPVWEQVASASCTGYALLLGASALGLGAVWKSAAVLGSAAVRQFFSLGEHEQLLGWINLGDPATTEDRRGSGSSRAVDVAQLITVIGEMPEG